MCIRDRDEDTLDTWFSSALWPFSTLGWPDKTEDLDYFYPTDVLVTGYDIIFFWVIRMVFSGYEHTGKSPFHTVLILSLIHIFHFDRNGSVDSKGKCDFELYRKDDNVVDSEIPGYTKISELSEIENGGQYLIAMKATVEGNNYYLLNPATGNEKYSYVAKDVYKRQPWKCAFHLVRALVFTLEAFSEMEAV